MENLTEYIMESFEDDAVFYFYMIETLAAIESQYENSEDILDEVREVMGKFAKARGIGVTKEEGAC